MKLTLQEKKDNFVIMIYSRIVKSGNSDSINIYIYIYNNYGFWKYKVQFFPLFSLFHFLKINLI